MSRKAPRLSSDAASHYSGSVEDRWQAVFGCPAPIRPAAFLEAALAWRAQVDAHGDISPEVRSKLAAAADEARAARMKRASGISEADTGVDGSDEPGGTPARAAAPAQLSPGTRLVKIHRGQTHVVEVTADGMLYQGKHHSSLSAVAKAITGTHWNGLLFFGLRKRKPYPKASTNG